MNKKVTDEIMRAHFHLLKAKEEMELNDDSDEEYVNMAQRRIVENTIQELEMLAK